MYLYSGEKYVPVLAGRLVTNLQVSRLFVQIFLSHYRKNSFGTLRCFRKFRESKNFIYKKGISLFSVEFFCHTVPIKFVGEPFCFKKILVSKSFMHRRGASRFCRKLFVLQCQKNSLGNTPVFRKFGLSKKFMHNRGGGGYHDFPSNIFCLTVPKNLVPGNLVFQKSSGIENFFGQ